MTRFDQIVEFYQFAQGRHDFYRCHKCRSIFTLVQERQRLSGMSEDTRMFICCTSLRYEPTVPFWYEWFYPRVLSFALKVVLARVVAPWAERKDFVALWARALTVAGRGI